jgi:hypothetical protein
MWICTKISCDRAIQYPHYIQREEKAFFTIKNWHKHQRNIFSRRKATKTTDDEEPDKLFLE